jgi:hypothetical protein
MSKAKHNNNKPKSKECAGLAINDPRMELNNGLVKRMIKQLEDNDNADWFRFYISIGFALFIAAIGIAFVEPSFINLYEKIGLVILLATFGLRVIYSATVKYKPETLNRRYARRSITLLALGAIFIMVGGILFPMLNLNIAIPLLLGIILLIVGWYFTNKAVSKSL